MNIMPRTLTKNKEHYFFHYGPKEDEPRMHVYMCWFCENVQYSDVKSDFVMDYSVCPQEEMIEKK